MWFWSGIQEIFAPLHFSHFGRRVHWTAWSYSSIVSNIHIFNLHQSGNDDRTTLKQFWANRSSPRALSSPNQKGGDRSAGENPEVALPLWCKGSLGPLLWWFKDIVTNFSEIHSILGHPKTKAFITHCGTNCIYDANYHGIPMMGIPLFADPPDNIAHLKAKGGAISLNLIKCQVQICSMHWG